MIADEVEVGMPQSSIPHGYVDLMVVSLLFQSPPVCFFNFMEYKFYHCTTASFKNPQSFAQEASGKLILRVYMVILPWVFKTRCACDIMQTLLCMYRIEGNFGELLDKMHLVE